MKRILFVYLVLLCLCLSSCSNASTASDVPTSIPIIGGETSTSADTTQSSTSSSTTTSSTTETVTTTTTLPAENTGESIARLAYSLLGTSFKYGGIGPTEFDNPGFVYYCYKQHGITVPRRSANMAESGQEVSKDDLAPGDIVLFNSEVGGPPSFVGIYTGNGEFVGCHNPEKGTVLRDMTTRYYTEHFVTARRYW